jgi:hypothetical protein
MRDPWCAGFQRSRALGFFGRRVQGPQANKEIIAGRRPKSGPAQRPYDLSSLVLSA